MSEHIVLCVLTLGYGMWVRVALSVMNLISNLLHRLLWK